MVLGIALFTSLLALTLAVWLLALGEMPLPGFEWTVAEVEELILSWGIWGMAASVLLMVLHSFVPFPAEMVAMANGMLYGPLLGTTLTWIGAMLGAWLAFGLARLFGRPFVQAMLAERHHVAIDRWAERQGTGALIFSRLIPVISFNLINYAAGLTSISWWTFTWATGLGILPLTALMVLMGDRLWSGETGVGLWLALAAVVGWLVWWMVSRRAADRDPQTGQKYGRSTGSSQPKRP
ncbi:MAG: TVP38/TMEM64 family protein [Geminicoccaceae bacterium]|nr:TVP38/TMEM64 family protein [Geminicoccaceae bacterium]